MLLRICFVFVPFQVWTFCVKWQGTSKDNQIPVPLCERLQEFLPNRRRCSALYLSLSDQRPRCCPHGMPKWATHWLISHQESRDIKRPPSTLQLRSAEPQFALLLCTSLSILFYIHHVEDTSTAQSSRFCACIPLGLLPLWSPFCSPAVDKLAHRPQPAPNRDFHGAFTCSTRKSADWQCNQDGCELMSSFTYLQGSIRSIWLGECQSQTAWASQISHGLPGRPWSFQTHSLKNNSHLGCTRWDEMSVKNIAGLGVASAKCIV